MSGGKCLNPKCTGGIYHHCGGSSNGKNKYSTAFIDFICSDCGARYEVKTRFSKKIDCEPQTSSDSIWYETNAGSFTVILSRKIVNQIKTNKGTDSAGEYLVILCRDTFNIYAGEIEQISFHPAQDFSFLVQQRLNKLDFPDLGPSIMSAKSIVGSHIQLIGRISDPWLNDQTLQMVCQPTLDIANREPNHVKSFFPCRLKCFSCFG